MAHIKIDFDGLTQQASLLNNYAQSYESLNSRMNALTQQISSSWEGESSKAYLEMMQKYYQQSQKIVGIINAFRGYATGASNDFDDVDRRCAGLIRGAF